MVNLLMLLSLASLVKSSPPLCLVMPLTLLCTSSIGGSASGKVWRAFIIIWTFRYSQYALFLQTHVAREIVKKLGSIPTVIILSQVQKVGLSRRTKLHTGFRTASTITSLLSSQSWLMPTSGTLTIQMRLT